MGRVIDRSCDFRTLAANTVGAQSQSDSNGVLAHAAATVSAEVPQVVASDSSTEGVSIAKFGEPPPSAAFVAENKCVTHANDVLEVASTRDMITYIEFRV